MTESLQPFEALAFANHRNGSPIKLPRGKGEVAMLAFDQRKSRLVELHILTGETEKEEEQALEQPPTIRRIKPASLRSRRKAHASRELRPKPKAYGRHRPVRCAPLRIKYLDRFEQPKVILEQPEAKPEVSYEDLQLCADRRLRGVLGLRGDSFMTIHETGMDDGMAYYVTNLNDGEFVQDYVRGGDLCPR